MLLNLEKELRGLRHHTTCHQLICAQSPTEIADFCCLNHCEVEALLSALIVFAWPAFNAFNFFESVEIG